MNAPLPHALAQAAEAETPKLFQPGRIGDIPVANRVVMAPLTRSRADEAAGDIPGSAMNVEYYRAEPEDLLHAGPGRLHRLPDPLTSPP